MVLGCPEYESKTAVGYDVYGPYLLAGELPTAVFSGLFACITNSKEVYVKFTHGNSNTKRKAFGECSLLGARPAHRFSKVNFK